MGFMLDFISKYATAGIVVFGIVIMLLLFWNGITLSNQKSRIKEALERRNHVYKFNPEDNKMEEDADEKAAITPDTIRKYETDFNKKCSWHGVLVQCIPIFPLLGILGTVAGLMLELQAGDIDAMMQSLDVALETTLWGLIFAILLKLMDAIFPARVVYDVEVLLDDFDKKMNLANTFHKIKKVK